MTTAQKIAEIELEMEKTQRNKATSYHLGLLKAKLAKLKREMIEPAGGKKGSAGEGFEVSKSGDARVGMIGFPSVGKSTLLTKLTGKECFKIRNFLKDCRLLVHNLNMRSRSAQAQGSEDSIIGLAWNHRRSKGWKGSWTAGHRSGPDLQPHRNCA